LIDLKEAEWIEFSDRDHRAMRLAIDKSTHLPLRWVVTTRDPETRQRSETATSYTQYITSDGVKTPLSISRTQNGRQVSQIYLTSCKFNSNFSSELFTRASLEQRQSQVTKKGYKESKDNK
jgi:outer membrane usher protein FimD/PapC